MFRWTLTRIYVWNSIPRIRGMSVELRLVQVEAYVRTYILHQRGVLQLAFGLQYTHGFACVSYHCTHARHEAIASRCAVVHVYWFEYWQQRSISSCCSAVCRLLVVMDT